MHWIIFAELKKFAESKFGVEAWEALRSEAGLASKDFLSKVSYPDEDGARLVAAASRMTGRPANEILEDFGEFLAPAYLKHYGMLVRPEWRTLEAIEHTESMIHAILRVRDPNARPPELRVRRTGPDEVVLVYDSQRKMCGVAKGIARALAKHYGERLSIVDVRCQHRGSAECEIVFKRLPGAATLPA